MQEQEKPSQNRSKDRSLHSRRDLVRHGMKLAFVAPVLSTFFAKGVYAANYSCYPTGHACTQPGPDPEECCSTICAGTVCL